MPFSLYFFCFFFRSFSFESHQRFNTLPQSCIKFFKYHSLFASPFHSSRLYALLYHPYFIRHSITMSSWELNNDARAQPFADFAKNGYSHLPSLIPTAFSSWRFLQSAVLFRVLIYIYIYAIILAPRL